MLESCEQPIIESSENTFQPVTTPEFELDREKLQEQLQTIVESDYFQNLILRAKELREKRTL